ncbi:MAG: hypothetical protein Q4B78_05340, partial [Bacillota bacterium]|nr:hypothetical protein [Bacillota bacterium]
MITKYEKQLELLDEIYEICEHLKITCVLWGQSARNAYFGSGLCNIAGDITLAMTGGDANRFISYFYKSGKKDRYVEGLFNNPMHRKSGFLYGDMNTFRYKVKADRRKIHHGIDIKICLLEQLPNRKTKSGIKHIKKAKILMYRGYEKRKAVKIVSNIAKVALNKPMNKYHISLLERVKIDRWEDL